MKLHICLFLTLLLAPFTIKAQAVVDSTYLGKDIFSLLGPKVQVIQDEAIHTSLLEKITNDEGTLFNGFRIRIFLDSKINAREESAKAYNSFSERYPYINADRIYEAPNFKVTVGNFRTRLDAESFLSEIIATFPEAFIVREKFKYPSIGKADTRSLEIIVE